MKSLEKLKNIKSEKESILEEIRRINEIKRLQCEEVYKSFGVYDVVETPKTGLCATEELILKSEESKDRIKKARRITSGIEDRANEKIAELLKEVRAIDEYEKVLLRSIISSSSFDISIMGDVLSKLAYGTEYKDFTYHEAKNTTVKGRLVPTTTNVCMILNQLYKKDSYSDAKDSYENVDHICKYGNGVVLYMGESIPSSISFYKKDEKGDLTKTVDFSLLPYMQDFIDFVIDYRVENAIDPITPDALNNLLNLFTSKKQPKKAKIYVKK